MFFKTRWYKLLPSDFRPDKDIIEEVEKLRLKYSLRDDELSYQVLNSKWATIRAQEISFKNIKSNKPHATAKQVWGEVIASRVMMILDMKGHSYESIATEKIKNLKVNMESINSWEEVLDYIFKLNQEIGIYFPGDNYKPSIRKLMKEEDWRIQLEDILLKVV